jgi:hypothetical protein
MEVPQKTKNRSTIISRPTIPGHTAEGMWAGYNRAI